VEELSLELRNDPETLPTEVVLLSETADEVELAAMAGAALAQASQTRVARKGLG
jgi:hypothetical protein